MIVKSVRIPADEALSRIRDHLLRGPENVAVRVLRGCEADLADFRRMAQAKGATYAIRHFIVAPQIAMTTEAYLGVVDDLAREFGFDPAVCVVLLHEKPRCVEASPTHLHVLVPEVDAVSGGILDDSHDWLRHEKLARIVEWRHGHPLLEGEHLAAVLRHLEREGHLDLCRALREAYPQASGGREAFTSQNAARTKRMAGLDLARLKQSGQAAWRADPTPEGLAGWIASEGLTVSPGDQPRTLVLRKNSLHIASLNRLLALPKGQTFEDLRHVPDLVAAHRAACERPDPERRDPDPRRDPCGPAADGGGVLDPGAVAGAGHGAGGRPSVGDPRRAGGDPTSPGGHTGEPPGPAPAPRPLDPSRIRRRTLAARLRLGAAAETLDRLASVREAASRVALTAGEACRRWIADGLAAIEAERARLTGPDDHLDAETERLAHRARMMKAAHGGCESDLARAKARMADVERVAAARARWGWLAPRPDPDAHRKAKADLDAAQLRFDNAVTMDRDAAGAEARERGRVVRLRKDAKASLPDELAALDRRAEALRTFGHLVAAEPQIAYGGVPAFEAWIAVKPVEGGPAPSSPVRSPPVTLPDDARLTIVAPGSVR
ncbi:hypothetical protein [Aureimonas sp. ME7]|uniref:hypothetical protein n=1 Tax=Aureimonas sp. ME7 TaxID=2744252 RepID=UPI0015F3F241|nr:hypothetical protein [Aureimonas sp. ME7]